MTNRELIAILAQFDMNTEIVFEYDNHLQLAQKHYKDELSISLKRLAKRKQNRSLETEERSRILSKDILENVKEYIVINNSYT